jgi:hypothetical protein
VTRRTGVSEEIVDDELQLIGDGVERPDRWHDTAAFDL